MGDFLSSLSSLAPSVALLGAGKSNFDSRMQAVTLANKAREAEALTEALAGADDFTYEQVQSVLLANGEAEAALRMMPNVQAERKTAGTLAAFQGADLSTPQGNTLVGQALIAAGNPKGADYIKAGVEMGRKETAAANTLAYLEQLYPGRFTSGEGIDLNSLLLKGVTAEQALAAQNADRAYKEAQTLLKHNRAQENIKLKESLKGGTLGSKYAGHPDKEILTRADLLGLPYDGVRDTVAKLMPGADAFQVTDVSKSFLKVAREGMGVDDLTKYILGYKEGTLPPMVTRLPQPVEAPGKISPEAKVKDLSTRIASAENYYKAGGPKALTQGQQMALQNGGMSAKTTVSPVTNGVQQANQERVQTQMNNMEVQRKTLELMRLLKQTGQYTPKEIDYIVTEAAKNQGITLEAAP